MKKLFAITLLLMAIIYLMFFNKIDIQLDKKITMKLPALYIKKSSDISTVFSVNIFNDKVINYSAIKYNKKLFDSLLGLPKNKCLYRYISFSDSYLFKIVKFPYVIIGNEISKNRVEKFIKKVCGNTLAEKATGSKFKILGK